MPWSRQAWRVSVFGRMPWSRQAWQVSELVSTKCLQATLSDDCLQILQLQINTLIPRGLVIDRIMFIIERIKLSYLS
jgi:hypothetical protein